MRHTFENGTRARHLGLFGWDTAAVLFFLALEYGRAVRVFTADGILIAITMAMLLVLPYFLPSNWNAPTFGVWIASRTVVALIGLVCGALFNYGLGIVLPESLKLMPMTFLILAGMASCYLQFYGLMKLRLAK